MTTVLERCMAKLQKAVSPVASRGDRVLDRRADETEDIFMERAKVAALAATTQRPCRMILLPEEALT